MCVCVCIIQIVYGYNVDMCKRKLTRLPFEVGTPMVAVGALFGAGGEISCRYLATACFEGISGRHSTLMRGL